MEATAGPWRRIRRRWLIILASAVVLILIVLSLVAGFYVDVLWFREVGFSSVFWTTFWTRILLGLVFWALFFAFLYANLLIARAIRPRYQVFSPGEEAVERYRTAFEPYARWVLPAMAAVFALFASVGAAGEWDAFQQWRVSGDVLFGTVDPLFQRDLSFYVLSLPFQRFVQGWLLSSLIVITLITAGAHYLWGGIRVRAVGERVTPAVKAHLSVLLGVIMLVKAWGYRLGQFELLTSPRGTVTGASYTDVHAQLPALRFLFIVAILVAILFLVNIRFRGWALPAIALGLLMVVAIVAGAIFPSAIQRFQVDPQELQKERPFIERNIRFTRQAFGIDQVQSRAFPAEPELTAEEVESNQDVIEDIRLWNPDVLKDAYLQLQRIRPYYEFVDVDVDRYEIEGEKRLVMIGPREITQEGIPGGGGTWQNRHLFYTHGFAGAATRVDQVTGEGTPDFVLQDIPPVGDLQPLLQQPRVYFQEATDVPFVVTGTDVQELDFPQGEQAERFARTRYTGEGGIEMGGFLRRMALAWRYRDVNLLISGLIDGDSRILINTDIRSRVEKAAPFLRYDSDPYSAIVDGRMVWIWDAYTTSDDYPYSQQVDLAEATDSQQLGRINYIRNSVKVVIDAYDGTMTFYVVDEEDPIIRAWQEVFPDLFTPGSQAPLSLREHFRYPEDMFRIQASQFANYHVQDPGQFYAKEDFWALPVVPVDPTDVEAGSETLEPYYVLAPLPGETDERFILFSPFTAAERPQMIAWMAGVSDPDQYGRLVSFEFPLERNVPGPRNAATFISQDTDISQQVSLWDQLGSRVIFGDLLAIPIGQSFLYVQPLYLEAAQEEPIPELKRVIAVSGERVAFANTLQQALAIVFGEAAAEVPEAPTVPGQPGQPIPSEVAQLLQQAEQHFQRAQELLQEGDLAGYQKEIEAAQRAVQRAIQRAGELSQQGRR